MELIELTENKKQYMELLLLADEQESMIDNYIGHGRVFVIEDNGVKAQCVITREDEGVYEIKNLATLPQFQHRGYGAWMLEKMFDVFEDCRELYVGTGDSPATVPFYEKCGFRYSHTIKNFFIDNYDHPIYDGGVLLVDMVYLKRSRDDLGIHS